MRIVREHINEKFTEDGDPIKDLGIGLIHKIQEWLRQHGISDYTINDDLTIDVDGAVNLRKLLNGNFPYYIQFNVVKGDFNVIECHLTTLRGCPKKVGDDFHCTNNKLTNLIGAPRKVGMHFCCGSNDLNSLEGIPEYINGEFYCTYSRGKKFTREEISKITNITTGVIHLK